MIARGDDRRAQHEETNVEGLLTVKQAAALLSVSEATMRRLTRSGLVPYVRLSRTGRGGVIRFRPEDLRDVVRSHVQNGAVCASPELEMSLRM